MLRQCEDNPFDLTHAPVFLAGVSASHGVNVVDTEFFKVSFLGAGILPLFPDQTAKSPDDPGFKRFEYVSGFGQAEGVEVLGSGSFAEVLGSCLDL